MHSNQSRNESAGKVVCQADISFEEIDVGDITVAEKARLQGVLGKYTECFSSDNKDIGLTHLGEMNIKLSTTNPVHRRPYRLANSERTKVKTKVEELLKGGVIRESESDYASPIIIVPKKNGEIRLCVDYRALNAVTVKDRYPMPMVEEQMERLVGKCYYTTLDLAQGYHQVPMASGSVHKTAFVTPDGHYEYLRVPFGLANSPAVFQRIINKLIKQAGLKLNLSKCSFLKTSISYLGHKVSDDGIRPGVAKIQVVMNFPTSTQVHERQFMALASYFRKFIKNFATVARPLTELTKKETACVWADKQEQAFQTLKQALCARPTLALYSGQADTEVHTDASKMGIGGILPQRQTTGDLKPVMHYSRATTPAEQVYHSYDLETLAAVDTIKRFRVYLLGVKFKLITDCVAIRATFQKKDMVPRVARWWLAVQEYDFEIEYRPGPRMRHVDALSRNPSQNKERCAAAPGVGSYF